MFARRAYMARMIDDTPHSGLPFLKMHGLGNDFVVIDARGGVAPVAPAVARALGSDRSLSSTAVV